jgi:hypothetical protein
MHFRYFIGLLAVSFLSRWSRSRKYGALIGGFALAILCCAYLIPAFAQDSYTVQASPYSAPPSSPRGAAKFTVSGSVIDAVTGEPIRKALVQLNGQQRRTAFSDGDGRFQFEGIAPGTVSLQAQKPGYFGEQELPGHLSPQAEVGPRNDSVVLKLTPESVISGKVTTVAGIPLEHVPLGLTYLAFREGRRRWEAKGQIVSDESGRFRFANLLSGTYYVGAGPFTPREGSLFELERKLKTGYPGVYYPGAQDLASASAIQLSAGQQAEANFVLTEVPAYNISGTINGYSAGQGVGIQLLNHSGTVLPVEVQFSAENGRFDVHELPAGTYVLKAFSQSAPNQPLRAEVLLNVASNIFNLNLTLGPAITIPISVHTESKAPVSEVPTPGAGAVNVIPPPLYVRLLGSEPGMTDSFSIVEGPPAEQKLIIRNVDPGRYTVDVMPQGTWYVQSAEYGQTNLLTDDLTVTAGAPARPVEVVLRNDGASLAVTVNPRDGKNLPATVVAIREGATKATPRTAYYRPPSETSQQNAGVTIEMLPPGDYLVLAFDNAESLEYSNPDALQDYLLQAVRVTLAPDQRAKVTIDAIRTGETSL